MSVAYFELIRMTFVSIFDFSSKHSYTRILHHHHNSNCDNWSYLSSENKTFSAYPEVAIDLPRLVEHRILGSRN
jgi:hypothetical protein